MVRSRQRAKYVAQTKSPRAAYLHSPNGLKATARKAKAVAKEVQAENEMLMTEAQLQQACEEVLEAALLDLEEKHKHLQASHRQQRLENETLEAVVKQQELAMTTAKRAHHRLEAQLRKYQRSPQLTRKQRQQLQILKQTGVSIEVLRRWADSNCSRLDTHGRPPGGTTVQPTPGPSPPEPTPGPSLPEPCDLFIPTQEASPGQPAARTAAYTAQQCLSTARLIMKTQVGRRRLPTCRRLFITEQCVVANTHRPGERTTVSRQLRVVYKYLRQRTLGFSGSGLQDLNAEGQAVKEVIDQGCHELLTNVNVLEHMMRGPHHRNIKLLLSKVAVYEQRSSARPVAMLKELDEEHLQRDGNSLNATKINTSIKEYYQHQERFINWWGKAVGVEEGGLSRALKKHFPQLVLSRFDYSLPNPQHMWRLPTNSVIWQSRWMEELQWKPDQAARYVGALIAMEEEVMAVQQAVEQGTHPDSINRFVHDIISRAAGSAGMLKPRLCPLARVDKHTTVKPAWFDRSCKEAKAALWQALRSGEALHLYRARKQAYRRLVARAKSAWSKHRAAKLLDMLKHNPGDGLKMLRVKHARQQSMVPIDKWHQHLQAYFTTTIAAHEAPDVIPEPAWTRQGRPSWERQTSLSPFIKHARTVEEGVTTYLLLPLLATWFHSMMRTGAWKVARISPLFKDTDPTDPNKYRMLAVSSVLYRLYANVLRHVLTAWCMTHKVLPAEQFGFIPGRSTMQPMFILRHLVHAQKASADAKHRKLFTAFIDFTQAYDHIPRQQLWEHLRVGVKLPQPLLACLEGLYRDDSYVLIDGPHRTPPVTPDQGVKQGCPISPLLFALYVHDISKEFLGPVDAVRVQDTPVTHFMYADDLTLVSTSSHGLQRLVCQLQGFADRKHLSVNVGKSKVMVFNGNSQIAAPSIGYKHEILPVVREFKYLGMHFNPSATPAFAATRMRAGMFLAMRQACKRAREYGVLHDPYALCHLIRAFVLPLGLYGSQVWGTAFLGHGMQLSNPVQTRMLSFLRFAARVRGSVSGLMVLHELGQLPLQLYWLRAACKFWNTAKLSHSDLLMRVIKADVELGRVCQASWSAQFQLAARELMGGAFALSPDMVLGTKAMEVKWLERWGRRWVGFEGDPRLPETVHRERCSYAAWFKHGDGIGINHMAPHLLNRQLSTEVRTSLTRFRLGNSGLGVEKARFEGVTFIDRTCTFVGV
ncbi:hypothetical protein QJQ45_001098 [Haematococcus lacustris]|nr:hypothetical protein QJQ45_001098 [Haematococcus lacustris]